MDGFNATIFAYGQSGSGKTFSMLGPEEVTEILVNQSNDITPEIEAMFGIVPRATFHMFELINTGKQKGVKYTIKVSYIEIYNESINDILSVPPAQNLKIREYPNQGMSVIGMQEVIANSPEAVFEVISAGTANKIVCSTGQNARSSRSHTVFIVTCEQLLLDGSSKVSKINLVDLAGSEKLSKTGAQGQALKEAQKINLSLTTLGRCIKALTGKGGEHIPFRESKLTLILKESLGGNSKTTLIVTGSMRKVHQEETFSTMQFAERAKMVKTAAKSNVKRSVEELEMMVEQMKLEINRLRTQLSQGNYEGALPDLNEFQELRIRYLTLQSSSEKQIEELSDALARAKSQPPSIALDDLSLKAQCEELHEELEKLRFEKETEKNVYEEFISEISTKLHESDEKMTKYQTEINSHSKELNDLNLEISARDDLLSQISLEKQQFEAEIAEYQAVISELREEVNGFNLGNSKELSEVTARLEKVLFEKAENDVVINKLEYFTQELLDKVQDLEATNQAYAAKIRDYENSSLQNIDSNDLINEYNVLIQELQSKNESLEVELSQVKEQMFKNTLSQSTGDNHQQILKMKEEMDKAIQDKNDIIKSLKEFKDQFDNYQKKNSNNSTENEEFKKVISVLNAKNERLENDLKLEVQHRIRLEKSLKFYEENHSKATAEIESTLKVRYQLMIENTNKQIQELQNNIQIKNKEIRELKSYSHSDYNKVKSDLISSQNLVTKLNTTIKTMTEEFQDKIAKMFQEKEALKLRVEDKMNENLRLKMDLSEKDSTIFQLKLRAEQNQGGTKTASKEETDLAKKTNSPHKLALFGSKKAIGKIDHSLIKNLYANIDKQQDLDEEDLAEERKNLEDLDFIL